MWNVLIVIIIAIILWMFNPLAHLSQKTPTGNVNKQTTQDVNKFVNGVQQQVDYSKQLQQQQNNNIESQ